MFASPTTYPQREEEAHPLLPPQSLVQQSLRQLVVVEQPLHPEPEPGSQPQPGPQRLQLPELQPQLVLELHLRRAEQEPEPQS